MQKRLGVCLKQFEMLHMELAGTMPVDPPAEAGVTTAYTETGMRYPAYQHERGPIQGRGKE